MIGMQLVHQPAMSRLISSGPASRGTSRIRQAVATSMMPAPAVCSPCRAVEAVLVAGRLAPFGVPAIKIGLEQRHGARIVPLAVDQQGRRS